MTLREAAVAVLNLTAGRTLTDGDIAALRLVMAELADLRQAVERVIPLPRFDPLANAYNRPIRMVTTGSGA